jgi:signal transduction histidine kinase
MGEQQPSPPSSASAARQTPSLRGQLMVWSAVLTSFALLVTWWALSLLLSDFVERRLRAELAAQALGIIAAAEWSEEDGRFVLQPAPADPRFQTPHSGWYWQVDAVADETVETAAGLVAPSATEPAPLARSASLLSGRLQAGSDRGPKGEVLWLHRETFTAPGRRTGLRVSVSLPADEARAELAAIRWPVTLSLAVLGLLLLAAQWLTLHRGLRDLERFAQAVDALRSGRIQQLPSATARELVPLAEALNGLAEANRLRIAHARAAAGDLAHALKTPLAVLANRSDAADRALVERMDRTIRWHLRRARTAALAADPTARAAVAPVLDDLQLVLAPEARRRGLRLTVQASAAPDFRGDGEDLAEIVGALAENAVRWARSRVRIEALATPAGADRALGLQLEIADDGPGIPAGQRARLLARGMRHDESAEGHGLGLAIADERVRDCGGTLELAQAPEGGLLVRLRLPSSAAAGGGTPP